NSNPVATDTILSAQCNLRYQKPIKPPPIAIIPAIAVANIKITSQNVVSIINNSGCKMNIYGIIKAAIANFDAFTPVRIGAPPEIPVAAKAASATGGVISQQFQNRKQTYVPRAPESLLQADHSMLK